MNRFGWLVKRELWENRGILIGPAIAIAVLTLAALFSLGWVEPAHFDAGFTTDKQRAALTAALLATTMMFFVVAFFVMFFYALDSLYGDRRDRSVLFWKSLPLSDAETVLSKAAVAALVIPLVAAAGAVLAQWSLALVASFKIGAALALDPQVLLATLLFSLYVAVVFALWYAPVVAYLLAWSAWAPKSPFMYAVVPPIVLSIVEKIALGTGHVGALVKLRLTGVLKSAFGDGDTGAGVLINDDGVSLRDATALVDHVASFLTSADLWLGLAAAGALLALTVWIRRYRDEAT